MKNAVKTMVSTFGLIGGLFGIEHGIGELLQGNVVPTFPMILAWPTSPLFRIIGGEPAMTIIPNLFITGILAIIISAAVALWSVAFVQKKFGPPVLILLSIMQLLVGGGIAPILQLLIVGLAALKINSSYKWLRKHAPGTTLSFFEKAWPTFFIISVAYCLLLFPGSIILGGLFPDLNPSIIVNLSYYFPITLILTVLMAFLHDASRVGR